ncbi:MAG: hypothetical protein HUJ70_14715 [Pseudobutyrivibrio sp.]|nr:hypothetical protein [Pseudobutyrivibrio sp.]
MVHYLKADIRRCVKRLPRLAALVLAFVFIITNLNKSFNSSEYHSWAQIYAKIPGYLTILIGVIELYFVFEEDLRNRIIQTVIGKGISRERIVFVKYGEFGLLTLTDFFLYTIIYKIVSLTAVVGIPAEYEAEYMVRIFFAWVFMMEIAGICMIFIFMQKNIVLTMLIYLTLVTGLIGKTVEVMCGGENKYYILHLEKLDILSVNNKAFALTAMGNAQVTYTAAMAMYIVAGVCLAILLFSREELEF